MVTNLSVSVFDNLFLVNERGRDDVKCDVKCDWCDKIPLFSTINTWVVYCEKLQSNEKCSSFPRNLIFLHALLHSVKHYAYVRASSSSSHSSIFLCQFLLPLFCNIVLELLPSLEL